MLKWIQTDVAAPGKAHFSAFVAILDVKYGSGTTGKIHMLEPLDTQRRPKKTKEREKKGKSVKQAVQGGCD